MRPPAHDFTMSARFSRDHLRKLIYVVALANLGLLLLALYLIGHLDNSWLLLAGMPLLGLVPMAIRRSEPRDIFEPIFLFVAVYLAAFWVRAIMAQVDFREFTLPWAVSYGATQADVLPVLGLAMLGLSAVYLGYYSGLGCLKARIVPTIRREFVPTRARALFILSTVIYVAIWIHFFVNGHYSVVFMMENRAEIVRGAGELEVLMKANAFVSSATGFVILLRKMRKWRQLAFLVPIIIAMPLTTFGDFETVILTVAPPLVMWHYCVRRFRKRELALLALVGISSLVVFVAVRTSGGMRTLTIGIGPLLKFAAMAQFSYWDNLLVLIHHFPYRHDFYHGRIMLTDFFLLIPRRIWESKPQVYGSTLLQTEMFPYMIDPYTGFGHYESFSFIGWGYADFGLGGAMFAAFCHGVVWRMLYEQLGRRAREGSLPNAALYGYALVVLPKVMRGFVGSFLWMFAVLLPAALLLRFASGSNRSKGAQLPKVQRSV